MVNDDELDDIPFTQEEIRQQEAFERRQKRNDSERAEPLLRGEEVSQIIDTSDTSGCPYCGSYEGDYNSCPECGHGQ